MGEYTFTVCTKVGGIACEKDGVVSSIGICGLKPKLERLKEDVDEKATWADIDTYEVCKDINKSFGCPPVPPKYAKALHYGCRSWVDYDFKNRLKNLGSDWYLDGTFVMGLTGDRWPASWPAYTINSVANYIFLGWLFHGNPHPAEDRRTHGQT